MGCYQSRETGNTKSDTKKQQQYTEKTESISQTAVAVSDQFEAIAANPGKLVQSVARHDSSEANHRQKQLECRLEPEKKVREQQSEEEEEKFENGETSERSAEKPPELDNGGKAVLEPAASSDLSVPTFHGVPIPLLSLPFACPEFTKLESYILSLSSSPKWKLFKSEPGLEIFMLERSQYSNEMPVFRSEIHFSSGVSPEFALNMFAEPTFRSAWDSRILQMNKIYDEKKNCFLHYHVLKFNTPMKNRDFLTLYYIRKTENEYRVVLKSTKHEEFPESEETERAKTYFGMYRVFAEESGTYMTIILQFNLYLLLKRAEELIPAFIFRWIKQYKSETEKRYSAGDHC